MPWNEMHMSICAENNYNSYTNYVKLFEQFAKMHNELASVFFLSYCGYMPERNTETVFVRRLNEKNYFDGSRHNLFSFVKLFFTLGYIVGSSVLLITDS